MNDRAVLTGEHYLDGDEASAEGAIAAGCRFFAGYPITPSTEIAERIALRFPEVGGIFIQMEDELAAMNAVLGASWGGLKSMTCTSGPGFSLMMENLGLGLMTETPCVLVNVQRGGPSTGLPTHVGQQDMMQARWGSHGDYEIIALCPDSPQELFDLTIEAFNFSETYRIPVLVMTDESVGHMTERVVIPPKEKIKIVERRLTKKSPREYLPYMPCEDLVPEMVEAGTGYGVHITGLTHNQKGYPVIDHKTQTELITRLVNKIRKNVDKIVRVDEYETSDAKIILVSYGITSRVAKAVAEEFRKNKKPVGSLKLITVWPFPDKIIKRLAEKVKFFIVPEINMGQIVREVERCCNWSNEVISMPNAGGEVHSFESILSVVDDCLSRL